MGDLKAHFTPRILLSMPRIILHFAHHFLPHFFAHFILRVMSHASFYAAHRAAESLLGDNIKLRDIFAMDIKCRMPKANLSNNN